MIQYEEPSWWYWAATAVLLVLGLTLWEGGIAAAIALSAFQVLHFGARAGSLRAFPVQVRIAYTLLLAIGLWPPLHWVLWIPAIGTPAQVLFGYCTLARCLALLPWNRAEPLTWALVGRVLLSPPTAGSILQGLPAARA